MGIFQRLNLFVAAGLAVQKNKDNCIMKDVAGRVLVIIWKTCLQKGEKY